MGKIGYLFDWLFHRATDKRGIRQIQRAYEKRELKKGDRVELTYEAPKRWSTIAVIYPFKERSGFVYVQPMMLAGESTLVPCSDMFTEWKTIV